jgi:hypothetical protein
MWTDAGNLGLWNDVKCSVSRGFLCSTFKGFHLFIYIKHVIVQR